MIEKHRRVAEQARKEFALKEKLRTERRSPVRVTAKESPRDIHEGAKTPIPQFDLFDREPHAPPFH